MESSRRDVGGLNKIESEQVVNAQATQNALPKQFVRFARRGDTTPSVMNIERLLLRNTAPLTITDFSEGQEGQQVTILGDGNTTAQQNTKIFNVSGSDTLLEDGVVYIYVRFSDGVWRQLSGSGGGGGAKIRYLAFPFGDSVALAAIGEQRFLFIPSSYTILHWYVNGYDSGGDPIDVTATFFIHRIKGAVVTDAVGAGTVPNISVAIENDGDTSDWDDAAGTAEESIRALLDSLTGGGATTLLLTLVVQTSS